MKKRSLMKACSVVLTVTMIMGLTACGGRKANETTGGGSSKGVESAEPSLAKQFVFANKELDLKLDGDDTQVYDVQTSGERVNVIAEAYHWDDYGRDIRLISMNLDGEDVQSVRLQLPEDDLAGEIDADVSEPADDFENDADDDDTLQAFDETDETSEYDYDEYDYDYDEYDYEDLGYSDDVYYSSFCVADNGYLYGIRENYHSDWSDPDEYIYESNYDLCSWDFDGNFLWEKPLEGLKSDNDEYHDVREIVSLEDGSVVLLISGDTEYSKMELDAEGNVSALKELSVGGEKLENSYDLLNKGNGEFVITYYDDSWTDMYLATYDIKTDTIKEESKLPRSFAWNGYNSIAAGVSTDIVYSNNSGIWGLSAGQEEPVQIMSFVNSDVMIDYLNYIIMVDDEHIIAFYQENVDDYESRTVGSLFTKRNPEDIPDKQVLVVAGNYLSSDVRKRVVQFNKSSEQYRIVTKEYDSFSTTDDYMAGYTQLNNDIISGNMPDILIYDNFLPIENYINKGLLADVGTLIAQDEELSKKEFMNNVFEAYKVNGKLYEVIPSFSVQTFIGKASILGDRTSWTFRDLNEVMASLPEGTSSFGEMTKSSFLYYILNFCGSDFVDVSTGKCNFDSQNFIDMLKYANTFPEDVDYDYDDDDAWMSYWNDYQSQYREDRTLLRSTYIGSLKDMSYEINGYFGCDVEFVGFPTESGKGSVIGSSSDAFALSAKSANLDAAWDFVRYYLTEEYQQNIEWSLPVLKSEFMRRAQEATQKNYYMDGNEKVEYDDTFEINGESVVIEPLSQAQVDQMVSFIESVDTLSYYNPDIANILDEEAASFFAGQKSAEEVAKVIQSRVQIYVDEKR